MVVQAIIIMFYGDVYESAYRRVSTSYHVFKEVDYRPKDSIPP